NLVDYARMNLRGGRMENRTLHAALAPWADGSKVKGHTPFVTPWRTVQIADRAGDLAPSVLGLNLNPPNVLASTDWIKPMKYVGIWWGRSEERRVGKEDRKGWPAYNEKI